MVQRKWILKEGVILKPYGVNSKIDNSNLTDAFAELFLSDGRAKKEDFREILNLKKQKKDGNSK